MPAPMDPPGAQLDLLIDGRVALHRVGHRVLTRAAPAATPHLATGSWTPASDLADGFTPDANSYRYRAPEPRP